MIVYLPILFWVGAVLTVMFTLRVVDDVWEHVALTLSIAALLLAWHNHFRCRHEGNE